ncbi:hypothetical protein Tco_0872368 [Tanacetum coccineum]
MISCTIKGKPLALSWGRTLRLDSGVRVSQILGFLSISLGPVGGPKWDPCLFLAITQEESARAYVALFEKLACQLVGIPESVMEATFIKGLKPALRATVRVMNPEGLNHAMELAVSIEDNELYEGVMQSKGVAVIEKYTPGHRCASSTLQVLLVDESDEAEERDLNFKSWNRGSKID